jgi:hypothetical protein
MSNGSLARIFNFWWPILVSPNLIEFLHKAPFFVIPQQKPGLPLGLTSISQTRKGFQGSVVDIDAIFKAKISRIVGAVGHYLRRSLASFICPRHRLLAYLSAWLLTLNASLKQSMRRRMHSDAVCVGIRPLSGLREGISFLITAAISCTCGCRLPSAYIGKMIGYCCW